MAFYRNFVKNIHTTIERIMDKRPLILITNDDGLGARGLEHLVRIAVRLGDVVVVAPDTPQSGKSSAITVNTPLYVNEHAPIDSAKVFTTSGTPCRLR